MSRTAALSMRDAADNVMDQIVDAGEQIMVAVEPLAKQLEAPPKPDDDDARGRRLLPVPEGLVGFLKT